jgi:Xaa-Pro aminopeptidase
MKDRFTRVLKGHIALATCGVSRGHARRAARYVLARHALWQGGVDYAHGTGHGVGSFLAVHEGPQRIGKFTGGQAGTDEELLPGMILSNEPGYYKAGEYGIRIENLILVEAADRGRGGHLLRLRKPDLGADRQARWSTPACSPATSCAGGTTITPACWRLSARSWRARRRTGWRRLVRRLGGG